MSQDGKEKVVASVDVAELLKRKDVSAGPLDIALFGATWCCYYLLLWGIATTLSHLDWYGVRIHEEFLPKQQAAQRLIENIAIGYAFILPLCLWRCMAVYRHPDGFWQAMARTNPAALGSGFKQGILLGLASWALVSAGLVFWDWKAASSNTLATVLVGTRAVIMGSYACVAIGVTGFFVMYALNMIGGMRRLSG